VGTETLRRFREGVRMDDELRPCPFCGIIPASYDAGVFPAAITCENVNCFVQPQIENIEDKPLEVIIGQWNKRESDLYTEYLT
jgi:hypothetical protein